MTSKTDLLNILNLREKLKQGKGSLGMWVGITDPLAIEAIAADCDLDWILIDMEHGGAGWDDLKSILLGWKWAKIPVFVRVPSHDHTFIARVLDIGASGVVVPFVNTPELEVMHLGEFPDTTLKQRNITQQLMTTYL